MSSPFDPAALAAICKCCSTDPCVNSPCSFDCGSLSQYIQPDEPPFDSLLWSVEIYGEPDSGDVTDSFCFDDASTAICSPAAGPCFGDSFNALICPTALSMGTTTSPNGMIGLAEGEDSPPYTGCPISFNTQNSDVDNSWQIGPFGPFTLINSETGESCHIYPDTCDVTIYYVYDITYDSYCVCAPIGGEDSCDGSTDCNDGDDPLGPGGLPCDEGCQVSMSHIITVTKTGYVNSITFDNSFSTYSATTCIYTTSWCDEIDFGWIKINLQKSL